MLTTLLIAGAAALAQPGAGYDAPDYDAADSWLCRPGREDACAIDLDASVVHADGTVEIERHVAAEDPAADCFYVYPTVSSDAAGNSDLVAGDEERSVIAAQFARFNSVCRTFAPMYRQITLIALRSMISGEGDMGMDGMRAYMDVLGAFQHYLANDNEGRPFVLIGHSQGANMLERLVADAIDGTALQDQMLSAMLIGFNATVAVDGSEGGSFQSVPPCAAADQTGCFISYVSFRADAPPPDNARFGQSGDPALQVACTNPAAPGSAQDVPLDAYLNAGSAFTSSAEPDPWVAGGPEIVTRFVRVPGLLSGQCVADERGDYLAITVHSDPADPRTDDIVGDIIANGSALAGWGLHLIDIGLAQGDLIALVETQAAAHGE